MAELKILEQQETRKEEQDSVKSNFQEAYQKMKDEDKQDMHVMIITREGLPFCVKVKDLPKWKGKGLID